MVKKVLVALLLLLFFSNAVNAKQFSECSSDNNELLDQAFQKILAIYPEDIQKSVLNNTISPVLQNHDYGDLRIEGRFIFKGNERVQGIMVNYFLHKRLDSIPQFAEDVVKMKQQGVLGVSLEVPWHEYESQDNAFTPPEYIEKALDIIEANGLYSTLLLSPHYTPDWFFEKHGDVYMHRPDNTPVIWDNIRTRVPESGAYMTYSPFAEEASKDQIAFSSHAVQHYEQRPSMLAIFLSNEQTYSEEIDVDYSSFAATAWKQYLANRNDADVPLPTDRDAPNYRVFEYFLQDGLNAFHNRIITAVKSQQKTSVPLADRLLLYESMSDHAHKFHQRPLMSTSPASIIANDVYGFTPNVFALQYNYGKPVIVAETNMLGVCTRDAMYDYLMLQFLHGSSVISVFKWEKGNDTYSLLNSDGSFKDRARGVFSAAKKIQTLTNLHYLPITKRLLLDRDAVLDAAHQQTKVDSDSAIEAAWAAKEMPALHWADEIQPTSNRFPHTFILFTVIGIVLGAIALKFFL